jgi:hypothetical protein
MTLSLLLLFVTMTVAFITIGVTTLSSSATGLYLIQERRESGCKAFLLGLTVFSCVIQCGACHRSFMKKVSVLMVPIVKKYVCTGNLLCRITSVSNVRSQHSVCRTCTPYAHALRIAFFLTRQHIFQKNSFRGLKTSKSRRKSDRFVDVMTMKTG